MSKEEHKEWLLEQIRALSEHLKEGRFDEIDLAAIEKEAADMARNFRQVIESLDTAGQKISLDSHDLPTITKHLTHISQSTEKGVMNAINQAEAIMEDASAAKDSLEQINEQVAGDERLVDRIQSVNHRMDSIQDQCFSVITSLEFEDINRQVMEKILIRLNVLYDNLLKILVMLKLKERFENNDSTFLDSLKHIIDLDGANRQSQEKIDEFFEDFGL